MSLRSEIEHDVIDLYDTLDPSGRNSERMKRFFKTMTDKQFYKYYYEFFSDEERQFPTVSYIPYDNPVNCEFVFKVADKYDIPITEIMYMPYGADDPENPPGTICPVMILDYPMKRLKQMSITKNHSSGVATNRSTETGQVTGHDKVARETDMETYSLIVQQQYAAAREFYGPQADGLPAKYEMLKRIRVDGSVSLEDLPNEPENKTTLNTLNYYMLGAGFETSFISDNGYVLPQTIAGKEDKQLRVKR